jgi:hypothetical protein
LPRGVLQPAGQPHAALAGLHQPDDDRGEEIAFGGQRCGQGRALADPVPDADQRAPHRGIHQRGRSVQGGVERHPNLGEGGQALHRGRERPGRPPPGHPPAPGLRRVDGQREQPPIRQEVGRLDR